MDFKTLSEEEYAIAKANFLKPKEEIERLILEYRKGDKVEKSPKPASQIAYPRTEALIDMTFHQKADYYWNVILANGDLKDMSKFTVDELDSILSGSLELELSDHGSSGVDIALERNIRCYSAIGAVIDECIRRGYLTEKECEDYLLGCGDNGRYCNEMQFNEWIMKHKR